MIKDFIRETQLKAQLNTGFSGALVVWLAVAVVFAITAFVFLCIASFQWLAANFGPVIAGLILASFFLIASLIALVIALTAKRRASERARAELTLAAAAKQHSAGSWLDPKLLAVGMQLLQTVGVRRLLPLAAAGFLATELGREWAARSRAERKPE